jgi:hypothetical protein
VLSAGRQQHLEVPALRAVQIDPIAALRAD